MSSNARNHRSVTTTGVRIVGLIAAITMLALGFVVPTAANAAVGAARIDLKVLVLDDGSVSVAALTAAMGREGVPYKSISISGSHTTITTTGGTNPLSTTSAPASATAPRAFYQAIVTPTDLGTLVTNGRISAAEKLTIDTYERDFHVRQVSAYVNPTTAAVGLNAPAYSGKLDGSTATVTAAATAGAFSYLKGSFKLDDVDPLIDEVYGYVSTPATPAVGDSFTPYVTVPSPTATVGSLVGVYSDLSTVAPTGTREEMVITAAANANQTWQQEISHGVITWMTRGVYVGYNRSYYTTHVDDIFLPDGRWNSTSHCTPGDDCINNEPENNIRMVPSDVTRLTTWQSSNSYQFDLLFNGGGSDQYIADNGSDPLLTSLLAVKNQFRWVNHTYTHLFLGCTQDLTVRPWVCQANPGPGDVVPGDANASHYAWMSQSAVTAEIQSNQSWATSKGLPYNSTELVTGEHSGLLSTPQQPMDNPNLAGALSARGILVTGSDASREAVSRTVGSAKTLPRHPSNIYYNVGTFGDEVSEYNWIYTSAANGGSGICETSGTSTCITPLANANASQAQSSFLNFIVPRETQIALANVLTNDPRPHYAHQSNLAEDAILLTQTQAVLSAYRAVFADNAPIQTQSMTDASLTMSRATTWAAAQAGTTAYLDATGVHATGGASTIPLTVPTGTTGATVASLSAYAGSLSGWTSGSLASIAADPGDVGYGNGIHPSKPAAPAAPTGVPGDTVIALTWAAPVTAPGDGNAPITSYTITPSIGAVAQTPIVTAAVPAGTAVPTTLNLTGLVNGTSYTFTVAATNALGTGLPSPASAVLIPRTLPGAPTAVAGTPGNGSAALTWTAPASNGGTPITSYTVTPYIGAVAQTPVVTGSATASFNVTGLTNGTDYTFTVAATTVAGTGAASAASAVIRPRTVPGTPTAVAAAPDEASVQLAWTAPASTGGMPITSYTVTPYIGAVAQPAVITPTAVAPTAGAPFVVTGLTNGTAYTFTVAATNVAGTGVASAATTAVTPRTNPDAPSSVTATAGDGKVTLGWTPPSSDGGAPVTSYVVTPYVGVTAWPSVDTGGAGTTFDVTGLTNGTAYTFKVAAKNPAGVGPKSGQSLPATPRTVPDAPTAVAGTRGDTKASLSWTAPAFNGGSVVTSYLVTPYKGGVAQAPVTVGAVTSATISGLVNGSSYTFTVQAANVAGSSLGSAPSGALTPSGPPKVVVAKLAATSAPITLSPTVKFSWKGYANGSALDHYDVYVKRAAYGKSLPSSWTRYATVRGTGVSLTLKPGETVAVGVRAVDRVRGASAVTLAPSMASLPLKYSSLKKVGTSWTKLSGGGYYGGHALRSSTQGATLKAGSVSSAKRLAIVGCLGRSYGKAYVYIGTTKVATVNLKATKSDPNGVRLTKTFNARSGKVTIVLASGKQVRIEGIAVVR